MERKTFSLGIFAIALLASTMVLPSAFASPWYVGMGLKPGDYFRYNIADIFYHNLAPFELDFWIKNETSDGAMWAVMVAHDGAITQKGLVKLGSVSPDPVYADSNISPYSNVYHLTLTWLDSFAVKTHPVDTLAPVWGQTGIYGEVSIGSIGMQSVTVPGGTFDASTLHFHDSGVDSYLWVAPQMPFPVKAKVYAIKTSGAPSVGYEYSLLDYGNSATPPSFLNVVSTNPEGGSPLCPSIDYANDAVHNTQSTDTGNLAVEYYYSPSVPHQGCPMGWRISFEPVYSNIQRVSDVHYDIYTVDNQGHPLTSLAQQLGRQDIYVAVGDDTERFLEQAAPPLAHYVIYVAGTGAESGVTDTSKAGMVAIDVKIAPPFANATGTGQTTATGLMNQTTTSQTAPANQTATSQPIVLPSWIKNNAKWWSQGQIGDDQFVKGVQYMIQKGIIQIPATQQGQGSGSQQIPAWIKNNAGWWASGQISDSQFVQGLQYMITNGIITLQS
ncbi:MAG: hypothetical protein KGI33_12265 [Thaumarchaeota archaeon]|nr:hypothetical protein [Nitrososphaerota archaeon]